MAFGLGNGNLFLCNYDIDATTQEFTPYNGEFKQYAIDKLKAEAKVDQAKADKPGIGTFLTRPTINGQVLSIY